MLFKESAFQDRTVVITGGGTGIGLALVRAFAGLGANVVIASRKLENCQTAAAEVQALGRKALALEVNVRDHDSVDRLGKAVISAFGRADILFCNAGANFLCPASQLTANGFRSVVETVLFGSFHCAHVFGRYMIEQKFGRIIAMTATNGMNGSPMMLHSGAAKAGVINMMMTLAAEWGGFNVTCNSLSPGAVDTEGATSRLFSNGGLNERIAKETPLGRMAVPSDVVGAALFLASDAAAFINGANLVVDGGEAVRRIPFDLLT
jgi:NAD(P)-dependent dehydrogenase (short-subunit alcohol dehydrogenase family)